MMRQCSQALSKSQVTSGSVSLNCPGNTCNTIYISTLHHITAMPVIAAAAAILPVPATVPVR
jgi:hypothetical protein